MINLLLSQGTSLDIFAVHDSSTNLSILIFISVVLLALISRLAIHHLKFHILPESAQLILVGIIFGIIVAILLPETVKHFHLSETIFIFLFLPPLILDAGYFLEKTFFLRNLNTILWFAVGGTLAASVLTGILLWAFSPWYSFPLGFFEALAFGALISAIDPVAVLAVFSELHVNETLNTIVFGESLLNDAVSIVIYNVFLSLRTVQLTVVVPFLVIGKFFITSLGGSFVGVVVAVFASYLTKHSQQIHLLQPLIPLTCGFYAFVISEILGLSGIIAIFVCGVLISRYCDANIHRRSIIAFKYFLKMASSLAETEIFIYLGFDTVAISLAIDQKFHFDALFLILTVLICLFVRFLTVLTLFKITNRKRVRPVPFKDQVVMGYSGIRGAIAFILASSLPNDIQGKEIMISTTIYFTLFTIFFQGSTISWIIDKCNIARDSAYTQIPLSDTQSSDDSSDTDEVSAKKGQFSDDETDMDTRGLANIVLGFPIDHLSNFFTAVRGLENSQYQWLKRCWQVFDDFVIKHFLRGLLPEEQRFLDLLFLSVRNKEQNSSVESSFDSQQPATIVMENHTGTQATNQQIQETILEAEKIFHNKNINIDRLHAHGAINQIASAVHGIQHQIHGQKKTKSLRSRSSTLASPSSNAPTQPNIIDGSFDRNLGRYASFQAPIPPRFHTAKSSSSLSSFETLSENQPRYGHRHYRQDVQKLFYRNPNRPIANFLAGRENDVLSTENHELSNVLENHFLHQHQESLSPRQRGRKRNLLVESGSVTRDFGSQWNQEKFEQAINSSNTPGESTVGSPLVTSITVPGNVESSNSIEMQTILDDVRLDSSPRTVPKS